MSSVLFSTLVARPPRPALAAPALPAGSQPLRWTLPVLRIVLVEDSIEDFRYISLLLNRPGAPQRFSVTRAASYHEALLRLRTEKFDLGLFDQYLGDGSGLELLRELRAEGVELPVILLTGVDSSELDAAALQAGAVDYLPKRDLTSVQLERAIRYGFRQAATLEELRRTHRLLDATVKQLLAATDEEQQRLGADLHDGLGQQLTGLACLAAALQERLKRTAPDEAERAAQIARLANEATEQSRAIARGLCPVQLEQFGFCSALEDLSYRAQQLHRVNCRFVLRGPPPSQEPVAEKHLFRITQEAIHNAVRHGAPRQITVCLLSTSRAHRLVISDDGCGFDPEEAPGRDSRGLRLMRHRAVAIGATLHVSSKSGHGTRVRVTWPRLHPPTYDLTN